MNKNQGFSQIDSVGMPIPEPRVHGHQQMPGSISPRNINIIEELVEITSSSVALNNGDQIVNQILTTANSKNRILVSTERAIFINSVAAANILPGGSGVDESQWQIIALGPAIYAAASGATEEYENADQIYVRNISAGPVTLIFQSRSKYIINGGGVV